MTRNELLQVYKEKLSSHNGSVFLCSEHLQHILWMLDEIPKMTDEGKINRWLGFVQGYFWEAGIYTIDDMREHVRQIL